MISPGLLLLIIAAMRWYREEGVKERFVVDGLTLADLCDGANRAGPKIRGISRQSCVYKRAGKV
jgi:hypothetical protein